uniref:Uncharacterized protein n=1 Tax=Romanomermis culicivorax TaxID=13658 RepID=A0A915KDK5_ROMCU
MIGKNDHQEACIIQKKNLFNVANALFIIFKKTLAATLLHRSFQNGWGIMSKDVSSITKEAIGLHTAYCWRSLKGVFN